MQNATQINLSSYNFWQLDDSKMIHIENDIFNFSEKTVFFTPHKIAHYVLRWIKQGSGKVTINFITYDIEPGMIFIGTPEQVRQFDVNKSTTFETYYVAFKKEVFALMNIQGGVESVILSIRKNPFFKPQGHYCNLFEGIFSLLIKLPHEKSTHYSKIVASLIQTLLISVADHNDANQAVLGKGKQNYLNIYRQFLEQLNANFKKYHFTSDYVDLMFIPLKRLNRAVNSVTGKTAGRIITDRLDFEAKRYLYYSSNTIKEISYELGFSDPTYFIKFFRTKNGVSPNAFRQNISKHT